MDVVKSEDRPGGRKEARRPGRWQQLQDPLLLPAPCRCPTMGRWSLTGRLGADASLRGGHRQGAEVAVIQLGVDPGADGDEAADVVPVVADQAAAESDDGMGQRTGHLCGPSGGTAERYAGGAELSLGHQPSDSLPGLSYLKPIAAYPIHTVKAEIRSTCL